MARKVKSVPQGVLGKFFAIAKSDCCNFSLTGSYGKTDYCWLGCCTCLLKENKPCQYFGSAVIVYKPFRDKGLDLEWQDLVKGTGAVKNKLCGCGEEFRQTGPRQMRCPACRKLSRTEQARNRKRRQREKGVG